MGKKSIIHNDHGPFQFMQTKGKLQNDHHLKWSMYLQKIHFNINYKNGNTNHVTDFLNQPSIMALTKVLNSCGHAMSGWP